MLDSIYHMTLRLLCYLISGIKSCYVSNIVMDVISYMQPYTKICKPLVVLSV